jgi:ABC-type polysaccharide/polyol phosphate export permease
MQGGEQLERLQTIGQKPPLLLSPVYSIQLAIQNRFLIRNLVTREVRGRYRNAMIGYGWTVLEPALLTVVYFFLFYMLVGNPDKLYSVWVLVGIIIWGCFGKSLQATVTSLTRNKNTIHIVYFPRLIFPLSAVLSNITITLMSCVVLVPILFFFDLPFTLFLLYVPLSVFLSGLLAIGLGMMLAPLNCVYGDIEHLTRFIVRAGFFVSPVMWTYEMAVERGGFGELAMLNPMLTPITLARHGLEGKLTTLPIEVVALCMGVAVVLWVTGSWIFERYEQGAVKYL